MTVNAPVTSICTSNIDLIRLNVSVDAAVETRSAFGDSEFASDVVLRAVPVWLIGSEGQRIQVNAFLDDGSDSTYVRDDIVTALGLKTDERTLRLTTLTASCIFIKKQESLAGDRVSMGRPNLLLKHGH